MQSIERYKENGPCGNNAASNPKTYQYLNDVFTLLVDIP